MNKHKAPTQVTLASTQERTFLHEVVERYWKTAVGCFVIGTIAILIPLYLQGKSKESLHAQWDDLRAQANLGSGIFSQVQGGSPGTLASFADSHRESPVGAWARALEVGARIDAGELEQAAKASLTLQETWADHPLGAEKLYPGPDGTPLQLTDAITQGRAALAAWEKERAFLFSNPSLPPDAPRVRLKTKKGDILIGLYVDRAPNHAQNFLKLCREGFYTGTKFHRVVRGSLIQGGDPNSIAGAPETWGQGGPASLLEPEIDPRLRHFKGAVSAWKTPGETKSHGSQFFIATADQHQMDGQNVVFGAVLEGLDVVEAIESGAVVGDTPQDPTVIEAVEVL